MNRDNEEQKPIPQTFCGALQKEVNCKCLVLSVLIYGCLAAVTWCRCTNVTKIVINFTTYPIKSEKNVSPCDDGYIYIPVAFMGMLYLVYLVECYHSPIRIDLLHAESQNGVLAKLTQLKLAQPTIWWKAISYHYVRRKRQITRYRNGDNYTTTQVYYERVNTHAATSFYFYDYCGVKDISKDLILDPKIPITKITLTKGFAFSNVRSATEFEEARSRFFAEQEYRDDYMEMREGLDLGYNFNPITLVAVLGNPWFTNSYVYWCLSALLLSWPLRLIIEYKTQYVDYQITKLFGINYDTPTTVQIHTSASQLSAPGSYMLAPSYSEALLMDPTTPSTAVEDPTNESNPEASEMVPSYSEALLYERAREFERFAVNATVEYNGAHQDPSYCGNVNNAVCECPCHAVENNSDWQKHVETSLGASNNNANGDDNCIVNDNRQELEESCRSQENVNKITTQSKVCRNCSTNSRKEFSIIDLSDGTTAAARTEARKSTANGMLQKGLKNSASVQEQLQLHLQQDQTPNERLNMVRDISEPDLRTNSEFADVSMRFLWANGRSLENILENDESDMSNLRARSERAEALILEDQNGVTLPYGSTSNNDKVQATSQGAIPKRLEVRSRVTVNPISEAMKRIPTSRTYFCLKSILKHNRRRYTLVTTEELQSLARGQGADRFGGTCKNLDGSLPGVSSECSCSNCRGIDDFRDRREHQIDTQGSAKRHSGKDVCTTGGDKKERSRTLIFASPIQEICPSDPFQGKDLVPSKNPPDYEEALSLPVLSRLRRPFYDRESLVASRLRCHGKYYRASSVDSASYPITNTTAISVPSQESLTILHDTRISPPQEPQERLADASSSNAPPADDACAVDLSAISGASAADPAAPPRLTRSLTERRYRSEPQSHERILRKSLTERIDCAYRLSDGKRTNLNMETSL